jgi:hypothetical protein
VLLLVQAPVTVLVLLLQALLAAVRVALQVNLLLIHQAALLLLLLVALLLVLLRLLQVACQVARPANPQVVTQVNHQVMLQAAPLARRHLEAFTPVVLLVTVLL